MLQEHLPKEMKQRVFEVTYALYRVTYFFPHGEVLFLDLRREASEILKTCVTYSIMPQGSFDEILKIVAKIRAMRSILWLARANDFVSAVNIDVLDREYGILEGFFAEKLQNAPEHTPQKLSAPTNIDTKATDLVTAGSETEIKFPLPNLRGTIKKENSRKHTPERAPSDIHIHRTIKKTTNERCETILGILKQKDKLSIKDIASLFNEVSTKTIQRDLQELIERNVIFRTGNRRWSVYSLKRLDLSSEVGA